MTTDVLRFVGMLTCGLIAIEIVLINVWYVRAVLAHRRRLYTHVLCLSISYLCLASTAFAEVLRRWQDHAPWSWITVTDIVGYMFGMYGLYLILEHTVNIEQGSDDA